MNKDNKKPMNPKREALIDASIEAAEFRNQKVKNSTNIQEAAIWESKTINDILLHHIYETEGAKEFNTFHQWKDKGATIKKGVTAFCVWGQPLRAERKQQEEAKTEPKSEKEEMTAKYKYWPMCYLFSDKQVIQAEERVNDKKEAAEEQQKEDKKFSPINLEEAL